MVKFGHWNTQGKRPEVGDVCLILDKVKGKAHFLQKFQLGRIRHFTSPHVCEIDFVKQNPEVTAALIRDLRSQSGNWQKRYQVKLSSCTRDVKGLAILTSQGQEQKLKGGVEVDLFVDQLGPEDRAVRAAEAELGPEDRAVRAADAELGPEDRAVRTAEAEQQRGGDLAADQVPEGDRRAPLNGTK